MIYNTYEELQNKVFENVIEVYEIFKNHFGEEFVDWQHPSKEGLLDFFPPIVTENLSQTDIPDVNIEDLKRALGYADILVWWPYVTVTNENDKSVGITDLYAKVTVTIDGTIPEEYHGFLLNRASYSRIQFDSNYLHSHISGIPRDPSEFERPCLGTGPIKHTINNLKIEKDEAFWMLFCRELDLYVTVESLEGRPYKYLEDIGSGSYKLRCGYREITISSTFGSFCRHISKSKMKKFITYYLTNGHLSFSYVNGSYRPALSFNQFWLDISNAFIEFYNAEDTELCPLADLWYCGLRKVKAKGGNFYSLDEGHHRGAEELEGRKVCTFKGNDILFHVYEDRAEDAPQETILLEEEIANVILTFIIQIINNQYGKDNTTTTGSDSTDNTDSGEETPTAKGTQYI